MNEIIFRDGDTIPVLGKKWKLRLLKSTDEIWLILAGEENFAGLVVPMQGGGFMYILTDKGNPKETFIHDLNEIFLTEIRRILNEERE